LLGGGNINRQRVYTFLSDEVIAAIDEVAASKRVSRSELMRIAIEQYITPGAGEDLTQNLTKTKEDLTLKDAEIARIKQLLLSKEHEGEVLTKDLTLTIEDLTQNLTLAKNDITLKEGEVAHLKQLLLSKEHEGEDITLVKENLTLAIRERDQLRSEQDIRWKELQQLRSELNQAKREIEAARSKENQLTSERDRAKTSEDQASVELVVLRRDLEHFKEALRLKDDEISFLRGHLSQLSEKLPKSLPPSEEEAKKKGWWQFWRRG
jgi:chromosome segregation ATPase